MKFEMISGDEDLFDGAPDWALFISRNACCDLFFEEHREIKEGGRMMGVASRLNDYYIEDGPKLYIIAERRPITEPEWSGEGLPPVGVECEMQASTGPWIPVHIIANYDGFSFGWNYDSRLTLFSDDAKSFRPIHSPQEIARDDAIYAMACAPKPRGIPLYDICEEIYDAIAAGKIPGIKLE